MVDNDNNTLASGIIPSKPDHRPLERPSCEVCAKILAFYVEPCEHAIDIDLGKVQILLEGDCPHALYFKNVKYMYGPVPDYENLDLSLHKYNNETGIFFGVAYSTSDKRTWSTTESMRLVYREDVINHPGTVSLLDTQWIDEGLVQRWIEICDETHGEKCKTIPLWRSEDAIRPTYLVDTVCGCLVLGSGVDAEYVALSYQWGQTKTLRNTTDICDQLLIPGAIFVGELALHVPQTIRDAFAVVRHLGQRYLWCDALCIQQDNPTQLLSELGQMHRIYACASFTIIAADGVDANYGLRGFKGLTAPRKVWQTPIQLAGLEQIMTAVPTREFREAHGPSSYYERAWTYQENLFSKRRLIFENGIIQWRCQCVHWFEDIVAKKNSANGPLVNLNDRWLHSPIPTLDTMNSLIMSFNQKILTHPEDAFAAFAGTQTFLHRTHQFGLIFGHPEFYFDITLSWMPVYPVTKRKARKTPHSDTASYCLPSWSWIKWAGVVHLPWDSEFSVHVTGITDIDGFTDPVAEWFTMESSTAIERRPIKSAWHKHKTLAQDKTSTLPDGWRRVDSGPELEKMRVNDYSNDSFPLNIPSSCFKHSSNPDRFYWYPVPVFDSICEDDMKPLPQTSYIFAQTSRAVLYGGKAIERIYDDDAPSIQITNIRGHHVGCLILNNNSDLRAFDKAEELNSHKQVELVATCKGYTGRIFDYELAKASGKVPWETQRKDCYYVLWIEWVDSVAYRRGCGVVVAEVWEQVREKELVDLILG
ncbi:HET-domain-containing protein [Dothidotthia symphoricarpi CBS 119687]|uniref:HET-domain-containing protein n=1 Tax=Dothidotthia symphoricarpi CBS 119687 TaxID=1392245 RepID=A0A6A6AU23_9PLEO|nr:HET-domain-containing protein [Dothidotthia symphoricarpi CBS 119687]KAF2134464.1 HET-domain-containing protein [Dothidotthia symphoricarpi CBS 119687]